MSHWGIENEPREEPWASDAEAELKGLWEEVSSGSALSVAPPRPGLLGCALEPPDIRCRTLSCWVFDQPFTNGALQCWVDFWTQSPSFDHVGTIGSAEGSTVILMKRGFILSDLVTLGSQEALANESKDVDWSAGAEEALLEGIKQRAGLHDAVCSSEAVVECRAVTCRVTVAATPLQDCTELYEEVWPFPRGSESIPTSVSADGKRRTYYLVREGFVFEEVFGESK